MFKLGLVMFAFLSSVAVAKECSSDFNCGLGQRCVKAYMEMTGQCMTVVDEFGLKKYDALPSTDSIGPNLDSDKMCQFNTDCPIGFQCQKGGKIYGNCVKR